MKVSKSIFQMCLVFNAHQFSINPLLFMVLRVLFNNNDYHEKFDSHEKHKFTAFLIQQWCNCKLLRQEFYVSKFFIMSVNIASSQLCAV